MKETARVRSREPGRKQYRHFLRKKQVRNQRISVKSAPPPSTTPAARQVGFHLVGAAQPSVAVGFDPNREAEAGGVR